MQAAAQGFKEVKGNKALNPTSCFPKHCLPYTHKKADSLGFVRKVGSQATVDARHAYHRLSRVDRAIARPGPPTDPSMHD